MYSAFDPERLPAEIASQTTLKEFVLEAGEALFIPAGWWHHVRALDVSISLGMNHFAKENNFDAWYVPGAVG
jgi:ribosomal protein L16 Arg81 hydroxylase